jgi:ABC-2 type transport system ATP-binding protein
VEAAIEVHGLVKSFGEQLVLDGIDFAVARGTVACLLGPNGAGKTTAVRIMSTLSAPDKGRVIVAGHDVVTQRADVQRRISLTGQYAAIDDPLTGAENLAMMGRLRGLGRAQAADRATELLELFDLTTAASKRVSTYSGGMRRRLDIAAGLVIAPEVIFLDEPTTGLDPRSRLAMWDLVAELATGGTTILLTTQHLDEAEHLADQIVVLDRGRIVAAGTPAELKRRVGDERLVITATDRDAFDRIVAHCDPLDIRTVPDDLVVTIASDGRAVSIRTALDRLDPSGTLIDRFEPRGATLDDVFLAVTGERVARG